jgi:hypothetical protein
MRFQPGFRYGPSQAVIAGALYLLTGETDGFAIDATTYDSVTAASYVGGPVGGTVAVIDTGTPANDLSNVPLDASNLVNSGTSPKMVHHTASPYVRWSAHNYQVQSQTLNTTWAVGSTLSVGSNATTAPDGTSTADSLTAASGSGTHHLYNGSPLSHSAGVNTWSAYVKDSTARYVILSITQGGSSWAAIVADLQLGTITLTDDSSANAVYTSSSITSVGSGWYRLTLTVTIGTTQNFYTQLSLASGGTPTLGDGVETWSAAGTEVAYFWGVQSNKGPIATPYLATTTAARIGIPQSYDAAAAQYGILVEPAATNLGLSSEALGNSDWNFVNVTVADNDTTAPDATTTAEKITANSGNADHTLYSDQVTTSASTAYTYSIYLKAGTNQYASISIAGNATANRWIAAVVDLTNGTITQTSAGAGGTYVGSSIASIGGGWHRVSLTGSHGDSASHMQVGVVNSGTPSIGNSATFVWNPAGTETVYAWGTQLELGSVATSYIPTLGSTVTRALDFVKAATSTISFSQSLGTVYYKGTLYSNNTGQTLWSFRQDGFGDRWGIDDNFGSVLVRVEDTTTQANFGDAAYTVGGPDAQISAAFKANDFALSSNGVAVGANVDTSGTMPTTIDTFRIGTTHNNPGSVPQSLKQFVHVPRRVIDGDLPTWRYVA